MTDSPWRAHITAADYENHMAATGQPQANAGLVAELFREHAPPADAAVLFAGAGTGQIFDYFPPETLAGYRVTCTDINPQFLERLAARFACATAIDDIESPALPRSFDLAIVTLVLEHVDWRRAVAGLCRIAARVFVVIQENPEVYVAPALTGTLAAAKGRLLDRTELIVEFERHSFGLQRTSVREVRDAKRMSALDFHA